MDVATKCMKTNVSDGSIECYIYKARLIIVARGFDLNFGYDYDETFVLAVVHLRVTENSDRTFNVRWIGDPSCTCANSIPEWHALYKKKSI